MALQQPKTRVLPTRQIKSPLHQGNSRLFILLLIGCCLFFFLRYTNRLIEYSQEKIQVERWQQKIAQANLEQAELLAYYDYIQTDPFVEEVSRRELLMARPGETWVVVLPDQERGVSPGAVLSRADNNGGITQLNGTEDGSVESGSTIEASNTGTVAQVPTLNGTESLTTSSGDTIDQDPSFAPINTSPQNEPVWRQWVLLFSQSPR